MTMRKRVFAAAAACAFTAPAYASDLLPQSARAIELGEVAGDAYYTVEQEGFRVVATMAQDNGTPVRIEAVLAPGQTVVLSTPRDHDAAPLTVEIRRRGDQILVQEAVTN
ncbi:hypothetical protein [Indioceanicola profundi]|uniref:hypothetical protein n=1 Tax=Indioceanicola profundi TaxID=2220096 RepID=UPI000E6ADDDC|nr:hypothetical protein [Indioceanicola profundi]